MKAFLFLVIFMTGVFEYDITAIDNKLIEYSISNVLQVGDRGYEVEWKNSYSGNYGSAKVIKNFIDNGNTYQRDCKTVLMVIYIKEKKYESAILGCYNRNDGVWKVEKYKTSPDNPNFNGKIEKGENFNGPSY